MYHSLTGLPAACRRPAPSMPFAASTHQPLCAATRGQSGRPVPHHSWPALRWRWGYSRENWKSWTCRLLCYMFLILYKLVIIFLYRKVNVAFKLVNDAVLFALHQFANTESWHFSLRTGQAIFSPCCVFVGYVNVVFVSDRYYWLKHWLKEPLYGC